MALTAHGRVVISEGELVAVVGAVGSGKSSLLGALLGDIKKNRGKVITCYYC